MTLKLGSLAVNLYGPDPSLCAKIKCIEQLQREYMKFFA